MPCGVPATKLYLLSTWNGPLAGERLCPKSGSWAAGTARGSLTSTTNLLWLEPALPPECSCGGDSTGPGKGWPGSRRSATQGEADYLACGAPSRVKALR